jgi:iron complex transport system substrate-binding protein
LSSAQEDIFMKRLVASLFAMSLIAMGCGDDAAKTAGSEEVAVEATSAAETTVASPDTTLAGGTTARPDTVVPASDGVPQRVISLSPTSTETLFAIGAGPQVIAVDEYSNFPAEALAVPHDLSGFTPNVEAIAKLKPDLVIHDGTTDLGAQLDTLGIAHLPAPAAATFDDMYAQIERLGAVTGHIAEAAELVSNMNIDITAAVAAVSAPSEPRTYFHEIDKTLYSVRSATFLGEVYSLFGLVNIADAAEGDKPYPQLSPEFVISANPDLIFLSDAAYGESVETVAARPGWADLSAVKNGGVVAVDADISSRWGPRVVDYVEAVGKALSALPVAG